MWTEISTLAPTIHSASLLRERAQGAKKNNLREQKGGEILCYLGMLNDHHRSRSPSTAVADPISTTVVAVRQVVHGILLVGAQRIGANTTGLLPIGTQRIGANTTGHREPQLMSIFLIIGLRMRHRSRGLHRAASGTHIRSGDELRLVRWNCA